MFNGIEEKAKMQVNIDFIMNIIVNNQLDFNFVDDCLGNTLQISCKPINKKISKISCLEIVKI